MNWLTLGIEDQEGSGETIGRYAVPNFPLPYRVRPDHPAASSTLGGETLDTTQCFQ
jgi:hypothetical protein